MLWNQYGEGVVSNKNSYKCDIANVIGFFAFYFVLCFIVAGLLYNDSYLFVIREIDKQD